MSLLLKNGIRLLSFAVGQRLNVAAAHPAVAQRSFLFQLLRKNSQTAFGRLHNFAGLRTEADFRRRVPIRDYEAFRPFINRIMLGEKAVLTRSEPFMFTMTSGTTGEPKHIPVTSESQRLDASLMNHWFAHALKSHPAFLDHKGVGIVSRAIEGYTASDIPFGSMSGLTYKNLPLLLRRIHALPYTLFEINDYDQRYFLMARFALAATISFIATSNPGTLIHLAQVCHERQEELIRAIHDGTPGITSTGQPELLAQLAAHLKPDPARARALAHISERTGTLRPSDCWPTLRLVACWLGGSVHLQARRLPDFYGEVPVRDLGYMASEGHFTVPCQDYTASGVLALDHNYYEFIPEEESDSLHPTVLASHEVEAGRRYSILLTTAAGLYRYRIGDIVEVAGFHHRAPLLSFIRKEGEMANITGEKLHVNHLIQAIEQVRQRFHLNIEQFRAAPDFARNRYNIYLEMKGSLPMQMLKDEALPELDRALARLNIEYAQKRASKRLEPPCLHLMSEGWAEAERRRYAAKGGRDAQYKWRSLCPEPKAADLQAISRTIESNSSLLTDKEARPALVA